MSHGIPEKPRVNPGSIISIHKQKTRTNLPTRRTFPSPQPISAEPPHTRRWNKKAVGKPPKTESIIGEFLKQKWDRDNAINVGWESFDATDPILSMHVDDIKKLLDGDLTTDTIGLAFIDHNGPFEVYLVDHICEFFGIQNFDDLTGEMFETASTKRRGQPLVPFNVTVQRRSKTEAQIKIYARSELQARQIAITKTEDITFTAPETVLDYQVIETIPLGLPQ